MSKLNAVKMATELRTNRTTHFLGLAHEAISKAFDEGMSNFKDPSACTVTLDFAVPKDVEAILEGEGFVVTVSEPEKKSTVCFPAGDFEDASDEEEAGEEASAGEEK